MIASSTPLLDWTPPPESDRHGATFDHDLDFKRLNQQQARVFDVVKDGRWYTPADLEAATGDNWASISARLRDFRKLEFGGFVVDRSRVPGAEKVGLYQYRLRKPGDAN